MRHSICGWNDRDENFSFKIDSQRSGSVDLSPQRTDRLLATDSQARRPSRITAPRSGKSSGYTHELSLCCAQVEISTGIPSRPSCIHYKAKYEKKSSFVFQEYECQAV